MPDTLATTPPDNGILDIPATEHHALPALSNSGMRDLAVSPLRYWYHHIRPDREPREETPAMRLGSALHCAVLEPGETFMSRYARALDPSDWPVCLDKMDDLRAWISSKGHKPSGTRKEQVAEQAAAIMATLPEHERVPILLFEERRFAAQNEGKTILAPDEWSRVEGMADALLREPVLRSILLAGKPEVSMAATDPETGVLLKARLDWMGPSLTLDLKTFSAMRGKEFTKAVHDAIYYEGYYRQAWFYSHVRKLATGEESDFVFAFVESDPPYETRIKFLQPRFGSEQNTYWAMAGMECRALIRQYAECLERFGDKPWRTDSAAEVLTNEDIRQFNY